MVVKPIKKLISVPKKRFGAKDIPTNEEAETSVRTRLSSLEKRRLIDNLLEEKRLAKELKDDLDDIDNFDEDGDDWDDDDL